MIVCGSVHHSAPRCNIEEQARQTEAGNVYRMYPVVLSPASKHAVKVLRARLGQSPNVPLATNKKKKTGTKINPQAQAIISTSEQYDS